MCHEAPTATADRSPPRTLSGQLKCAAPGPSSAGEVDSSIRPWLALTALSARTSPRPITPAFQLDSNLEGRE